MRRIITGLCLMVCSTLAVAQIAPVPYTWTEHGNRLKSSRAVAAGGPMMMGDAVSLSNGALSFSATDVSIAGNNALPVAFSRSYSVRNRKHYESDAMLADWEVQIPNISGVFATNWVVGPSGSGNRCSSQLAPTIPNGFKIQDFWNGSILELGSDGGGELLLPTAATQQPTIGGPYKWVAGGGKTHVSCLTSIKNGTGEGFLVTTEDGTRYWFDHMAQYFEPPLYRVEAWIQTSPTPGVGHTQVPTNRRKTVLYASRVEDRFGNYVLYTYNNSWNQAGKLTQITGYKPGATPNPDGRQITINYLNGHISTVSDGTRTWSYWYQNAASGKKSLTKVTLPYGPGTEKTEWDITFSAFTSAQIHYNELGIGDGVSTCADPEMPQNIEEEYTATIKHPSGLSAEYTVGMRVHGRGNVPLNCDNVTTWPGQPLGTENNTDDDENLYAIGAYSLTLLKKKVTTGLSVAEWLYSYEPGISALRIRGATFNYPVCDYATYGIQCSAPLCTSSGCATSSSRTTVAGPGEWTRYTHGNSYLYNEGLLQKVETGTGPLNILKTTSYSHDLSRVDTSTYPARYGTSLRYAGDGFQSEYHRPTTVATTLQDSATFLKWVTEFDYFALPTKVHKWSDMYSSGVISFGSQETFTYHHNTSAWVIGQVQSATNVHIEPSKSVILGRTEYDPVTALPLRYYGPRQTSNPANYGKLIQTLTYNADGTAATIKDGNNNVTTLADWYRGIPRLITYPSTPEAPSGATEKAGVNPLGWITSVTDQSDNTTTYAYDLLGRMASIGYPTDDTTAWLPTNFTFQKLTAPDENNIAAGNWKHVESTGNHRKNTYYDAQWRPWLTHEYDVADQANTKRFQRFAYDDQGRVEFASYPGSTSTPLINGTWTEYDALGRVTSVSQNSELTSPDNLTGLLTTVTEYLPGFQTLVTNPRGQQTTTSYMAYDQPSYDWPTRMAFTGGSLTQIDRDSLGRPVDLKRKVQGVAIVGLPVRSYTYNEYGQLCRTVEPETDTTLMGYDNAGNLTWSAAGLAVGTACELGGTSSAVIARKVTRTYDTRNRVAALTFPDGRGNQSWTYTRDGLPNQVVTYNATGNGSPVYNAYHYNKRRMLDGTGETMNWAGYFTWGVGYGYNPNGHQTNLVYPSGLVVDFAPNALGQPTKAGSYATGVRYFPNGAIKQFTYGNGIVHTMQQNERQLPKRSTDSVSGSLPLDLGYSFDANANVSQIIDYVNGRQTRGMSYDSKDRLIQTTSNMFGTASYSFDVMDNLKTVKANGRDHTYNYDSKWQLGSVTDNVSGAAVIGFGYDLQGNVSNKNGVVHDFDYGNRLREVVGKESAYNYDAFGRRVLSANSTTSFTIFQYSQAGQLLHSSEWNGAKGIDHIYLGGSLVALREISSTFPNGHVRFQHTDALGSPIAVTDWNKDIIQTSEYEPYGKLVNRIETNGVGYTGHVQDAATGLTYMQQRYYDPGIGRFLSVDPVTADSATGANFNRYWYANNNPYKFTDPDGRKSTARDGQIIIEPENPDMPSVPIPNTVGASGVGPDRMSFHDYLISTPSSSNNPTAVGDAHANNPTPGTGDYATPQGTLNNVGSLPGQLDFGVNMVRSFTVASPDPAKFTDITVNYTVNGAHSMDEGFVLQFGQILPSGQISNISYGEGNALQQGNWDKSIWGPQVRDVWERHHQEINSAVKGK